jgi:23S rRNA G2445 N2-methylase RlmL
MTRIESGEGALPSSGQLLRLVGAHGSNRVMAGELSRLVRRAYNDVWVPVPVKDGPGSVCYPFDPRMARVAAEYHRTSARVLWQVLSSRAGRLEPLYADLRAQMAASRPDWFWPGATFSVSAHHVEAFAAGERQIVGTVKNALLDGAAAQGVQLQMQPEAPDLFIDVRQFEQQLVVSVDLAGRPMHQRGYRKSAGPAPLREDVAALLVMLMRHDSRKEALVDPLAGAGTIGIEAALLARGEPNWCDGRRPSGERLPALRPWFAAAPQALFADTEACVLLNDISSEAISAARDNVAAAGLTGIHTRVGNFRELSAGDVGGLCEQHGLSRTTGVIISNPPYGERLGDAAELTGLYRGLAQWCRQFPGWRAGFLVANPDFEFAFGMRAVSKKPLYNGPLKATFYQYQL